MSLFQLGDFVLASGIKSKWKLECDAFTDEDVRTLAEMIRQMVGLFSSVEGVPRGGLRLANALTPFVGLAGPHLIVDDVLTTGGSITRCRNECYTTPMDRSNVVGAVVFARGQRPHWVKALFQMPEVFWLKSATRSLPCVPCS